MSWKHPMYRKQRFEDIVVHGGNSPPESPNTDFFPFVDFVRRNVVELVQHPAPWVATKMYTLCIRVDNALDCHVPRHHRRMS